MRKSLLLLCSFLLTAVFTGLAQYSGTGSFGKITSIDDFEADAYYVLYGINGDNEGAMGNSFISTGRIVATPVTVTTRVITDPNVAIVWKAAGDVTNGFTLYNEDAAMYCEVTDNTTSAFSFVPAALEGFDVSYDAEDGFVFATRNAAGNSRKISIYETDFRPYANPNVLHLYKLGHVPPPPTGTLELTSPNGGESYNAGDVVQFAWNSNDVSAVDFEVWTDDLTWETIVEDVASVDGANTYDFTIPENAWSSDAYKLKVVDASEPSIFDESDASFSIDGHDTELFWENFEETQFNTTTPYSVAGEKQWTAYSNYAEMNGYASSGQENEEDWLITNVINLDNTTDELFAFQSRLSSPDAASDLTVHYSSDYSGSGDPSGASWTSITATLASSSDFTHSGYIDLSGISGSIYIAFKYVGTTTDADIWQIEEIEVSGVDNTPTNLAKQKTTKAKLCPNPFDYELLISADEPIKQVEIFNAAGQLVKRDINSSARIATADLAKGLYIIKIKFADGTSSTQKIIKK